MTKVKDLKTYLIRINEEYNNAKELDGGLHNKNIQRGRSRSISGLSEDLFAELVFNEIRRSGVVNEKELFLFVDQPLIYQGLNGKNQQVYPDLIVSKRQKDGTYRICYMVDLKMDVGYKRESNDGHSKSYIDIHNENSIKLNNMGNYLKDKKNLLEGVDSKSKKKKNDNKKRLNYYSLSSKAAYDMVVICASNAGSKDKINSLLGLSRDKSSGIWVLSSGTHLNAYRSWDLIEPEVDINQRDWDVFVKRIVNALK